MDFISAGIKNLSDSLHATRDLKRINEIASILVKYGYSDLTQRLGIGDSILKIPLPKAEIDPDLSAPLRAVAALQELGPTFVKLGQLLSTRVDLFSQDWIEAFEGLQANVSPLAFEQLAGILDQALNRPAEEIFDFIETRPLASGSIAQVHRARLQGEEVVLKIQRPDIRERIEADLRIMSLLASIAEHNVAALQRYMPLKIVRQFATAMRRELDFTREARASERIRSHFSKNNYVCIPKVYWDYSTPLLSVQEYIEGIPANQLKAIDAAGLDRRLLARRGVDAFMKMALEDGFFHADPHPGNFFYLADNKLALIDFGLVGSLSEQRRRQLASLMQGAASANSQMICDVLLDWAGEVEIDMEGLNSDIDALLEEYNGTALADIEIGHVINQLTTLARHHALSMPADLTLLIKAIMILEGLAKSLDPQFDLIKEATPFVERAILRRYSPESLFKRGLGTLGEVAEIVGELPRDFRRILTLIRRGYIPININVKQLESLSMRLERTTNRAVIGIMVAALIVGSSIVMTVDAGPRFLGLPFFGLMGFISANIGGAWVLYSMWTNKK